MEPAATGDASRENSRRRGVHRIDERTAELDDSDDAQEEGSD